MTNAISEVGSMIETSQVNSEKKVVSSFPDAHVLAAFYTVEQEGKRGVPPLSIQNSDFKIEKVEPTAIVLKTKMWDRGNMNEIANLMNPVNYRYDAESDVISAEFIKMAKDRGSEVRVYRPAMMQTVNRLFAQPFKPFEKTRQWYASDVLLVEFDQMNRPLSLIARSHQAITLMGVSSFQFAQIIAGPFNMRHFENNISANALENAYLRTYK